MIKFKIGDKVVHKANQEGSSYNKDCFGTVSKIIGDDIYAEDWSDNDSGFFEADTLKLIKRNMGNNKKTKTEKARFKIGQIVYNYNDEQKSEVLFISYDGESECYKYLVKCLEDDGSLHLLYGNYIREINKEKVTMEELIECYKEANDCEEIEVIK